MTNGNCIGLPAQAALGPHKGREVVFSYWNVNLPTSSHICIPLNVSSCRGMAMAVLGGYVCHGTGSEWQYTPPHHTHTHTPPPPYTQGMPAPSFNTKVGKLVTANILTNTQYISVLILRLSFILPFSCLHCTADLAWHWLIGFHSHFWGSMCTCQSPNCLWLCACRRDRQKKKSSRCCSNNRGSGCFRLACMWP